MIAVSTTLFADVSISFDYKAMSGFSSNQFVLWIENESGDVVKTLFITSFTGAKRGYKKREQALNHWVSIAKPDQMSDQALDTISGATPKPGTQHFIWDCTDSQGKKVPAGKYMVKLEATLYQGSNAVYTGILDTGNVTAGPIEAVLERSEPDNSKNDTMLQNVRMSVK